MIIHSPIISGSLTFADGATFTMPDNGVYSGSFSGSYIGDTFAGGIFTGDGSSLTFGGTGLVSGSSQVEFNDVNNTPFSQSAGSVTISKNLIPTTSNLTLGSAESPFKDVYISSASLYIDGVQVLSSTTTEITLQTDANQSLKLVETGADTVQIQTENGDITLTATGTGNIELDAPIQIVAGNQILSSDGNAIQFGEDLSITGNITISGTVDGIDLQSFSGSVDTRLDTLEGVSNENPLTFNDTSTIEFNRTGDVITANAIGGVVSGSSQVNADTITNFDTNVKEKLDADGVISGSSQVNADSITNFDSNVKDKLNLDGVFSSSAQISSLPSVDTDDLSEGSTNLYYTDARVKTKLNTDGVVSGSLVPQLPSGVVSGSSQVDLTQTTNYVTGIKTRLDAEGVISGSSQVTGYVPTNSAQALSSATNALTFAANTLTLTRGDGSTDTVNLSAYLDDTNLARIISGSYVPATQVLRFTRDDASTFDIDASMFFDDTNLVTSVNTKTGAVTLVTDDIAEDGSPTNLWFTTARARAAFSAGSGITITNGTIANSGVLTSTFSSPSQGTLRATINGSNSDVDLGLQTTDTVQFAKLGVGGASDATYELKVTGDIGATGDIVAYVSSDERLKNNIELISNPIEKVQSLKGVTWEWNENASEAAKQSPNLGVIAQDVEKVLPQLVHDRENGFKGVDYAKLTGLLIEAIKEQQKQIDDLKSKLG